MNFLDSTMLSFESRCVLRPDKGFKAKTVTDTVLKSASERTKMLLACRTEGGKIAIQFKSGWTTGICTGVEEGKCMVSNNVQNCGCIGRHRSTQLTANVANKMHQEYSKHGNKTPGEVEKNEQTQQYRYI